MADGSRSLFDCEIESRDVVLETVFVSVFVSVRPGVTVSDDIEADSVVVSDSDRVDVTSCETLSGMVADSLGWRDADSD